MRTNITPAFANRFMGRLESQLLKFVNLITMFIDGIDMKRSHSRGSLDAFIQDTNSLHPTIFPTMGTHSLRKHAYSNILKILPPKNENFQIKNSYIFYISAQNIDCGYSLEPP